MKKFNAREVLTIILLALILIAVCKHFSKDDTQNVEAITKLRGFNKKIVYLQKVFHSHNPEGLSQKQYDENFITYLRGKSYTKPHKYRYLNRKRLHKDDVFSFKNLITLPDNAFTAIKYTNNRGLIFYDYNGAQKPNRIGKDIFFFIIDDEHIHPYGHDQSEDDVRRDCSKISRGVMCSMFYLSGSRAAQ